MCFHCVQREENECTYDTLPKRRGPDKIRGARSRAAGPEDGGEPPPRRRRRRPTTVDQAASANHDPQQYGVLNEVDPDPGFELLEGSALFGTTASDNEMLTVESGVTGHTVSILLVPLWFVINCMLAFSRKSRGI
jgi:hypothetical protein